MKLNLAFAATAALAISNVSANNNDANELIQQEKAIISELNGLDLAGAATRNEEPVVEEAAATTVTDSGDLALDFDEAEAAPIAAAAETIMPEMVTLQDETVTLSNNATVTEEDGDTAAPPEIELYDSELVSEPVMTTTMSEGGSSVTGTATETAASTEHVHHESNHQHKKSEKARAKAAKDHAASDAKAGKEMSMPHEEVQHHSHNAKAAKAAHHNSSMSLPEKKTATKSAKHSKQAKSAKMGKSAAHHSSLSMPSTTAEADHHVPHSKAHKNPATAAAAQEYADTVDMLTTSEDDTAAAEDTAAAASADATATVPETKSVPIDTDTDTPAAEEGNAADIIAAVSARIPDETPGSSNTAIPADKFTQEVKEAMLNGKQEEGGSTTGQHQGVSTHHMKENVDKLDVRDKQRANNGFESDASKKANGATSYNAKGMVGLCLAVSSAMAYAMLV